MKFPNWPKIQGFRDIKFGLDRVFQLLERLDNPHLKLPPTIHIAGTNGKGSTLAFLQAILEENGYLVHKYTSPHLVNFNERIIIAGKEIEDEFLNECLDRCKALSQQEPKIELTFFEGITAAAFLAFSLKKADILLLETGMGGELDATNILPQVLCSIITPISYDHQEFLGQDIKEIAQAKAGIIKPNCPVITYQNDEQALEVIKKTCDYLNGSINILNVDHIKKINDTSWSINLPNTTLELPYPSLKGDFQIFNASLAIIALATQKYIDIDYKLIAPSLLKTKWPARLQKIEQGNLYKLVNHNSSQFKMFLDSSHNIAGARVLKEFLSNYKDHKIFIICSMLKDKDADGFISEIAESVNNFVATRISDEQSSLDAEELSKIANKYKISEISSTKNLNSALKIISDDIKFDKNLILICGSLYLAGEFLSLNSK